LTWDTERGARDRAAHRDGHQPEQRAEDEDRLLDHHIEEILGTLSDASRETESGRNATDPLD
jgi:hypothetical protein